MAKLTIASIINSRQRTYVSISNRSRVKIEVLIHEEILMSSISQQNADYGWKSLHGKQNIITIQTWTKRTVFTLGQFCIQIVY